MDPMKRQREERAVLLKRAKELLDGAERRGLSKLPLEDQQEYEQALEKAGELKTEIDADDKRVRAMIEADMAGRHGTDGERFIDASTGQEVRVFSKGDSLAEHYRRDLDTDEGPLDAGRCLRALLTGSWTGAELERRAMSTTTPADGGILVPQELSAQWFDAARNLNVCLLAGAKIIPMTTKTLSLAAVDEDPSAFWKIEGELAEGAAIGLREILLVSKTLYCGPIVVSRELLDDAPNCPQILNQTMAASLAGALDRAAILGDSEGVGPLGLINTPNVQSLSGVGSIENYSDFSAAYGLLQQSNTNMALTSAIFNPSVSAILDGLTAGDDQPLNPPRSFESLKNRLVTNQVPNNLGIGENETISVMGDFTQMIFGSRLTTTIDMSEHAGDVFSRYQVCFRAVVRGDVALSRPSHFVTMSGITPGYVS